MLALSIKLSNGLFSVAERIRTAVKCTLMKNAFAKGVKPLFLVFVTFFSPPSGTTLPLLFKDHQAHCTIHLNLRITRL